MATINAPGKFSDTLDEYLYSVAGEGFADDEAGDSSEGIGWFGLIRGPFASDEHIDNFDASGLDAEDRESLRYMNGAIISEDSQGFVSTRVYDASEGDQLDRDWAQILEETSQDESDA